MRKALLLLAITSTGCWGARTDRIGEIAAHKWWKKQPSRSQVEKMVQAVIDANSGSVLFWNNDGSFQVVKDDGRIFVDPFVLTPAGINGPYGYIKCSWSTRPDRDDVSSSILSALDKLEYRDGPGSKRDEPIGGFPAQKKPPAFDPAKPFGF